MSKAQTLCTTLRSYKGSSPSSAATAVARVSSGPLFRTFPTFGLASYISIAPEFEREQQIDRQLFRLFPIQPAVVVPRVKDDRHSRMSGCHQFVSLRVTMAKDWSQ